MNKVFLAVLFLFDGHGCWDDGRIGAEFGRDGERRSHGSKL